MAEHAIGCWVERGVVRPEVVDRLGQTCPVVPKAGIREPFAAWSDANLLLEPARSIVSDVFETSARLTRAILFDKLPGRNWHLDVHQDLTIGVADRVEAAGFGPWSRKRGGWHCEAPTGLLSRMLTVRVHLDDADEENGCLLVAPMPAGRTFAKLSPEELRACAERVVPVPAEAGEAVVMNPLVPHASGRNTTDRHRRVLHMEFAAGDPGGGLRWRDEAEILGQSSSMS